MRVGPGGIEIHVNGKRTGAPDPQCREKGPAFFNVLPGQRIRKEQAQKSVDRRAQGHRQEVRKREAVGRDMRSVSVANVHDPMSHEKERSPQKSRADGKQVSDVSRFRVFGGGKLSVGERSRFSEKKICMEPVLFEMKVVLNQRGAGVGVISNAITMHNWIDQGKRTEEQDKKDSGITLRNAFVGGRTREGAPRLRRPIHAGSSGQA